MRNRTRQKQFIKDFLKPGRFSTSASKVLLGLPVAAKDQRKKKALVKALRHITKPIETITKAVGRLSVDETRPPTGHAAKIWP